MLFLDSHSRRLVFTVKVDIPLVSQPGQHDPRQYLLIRESERTIRADISHSGVFSAQSTEPGAQPEDLTAGTSKLRHSVTSPLSTPALATSGCFVRWPLTISMRSASISAASRRRLEPSVLLVLELGLQPATLLRTRYRSSIKIQMPLWGSLSDTAGQTGLLVCKEFPQVRK